MSGVISTVRVVWCRGPAPGALITVGYAVTEALVVGVLGLLAIAATTSLADRIDAEQITIEMRADGAEPR
jgi:uncharacterized membrane protein